MVSRPSVSLRFAPAACATAVVALIAMTTQLGSIPRGVAIVAVVLAWALPLVIARREVGAHATVVAAIAAVVAAGQTRVGWSYGVAAAALVLVSLASMRRARVVDHAHALRAHRMGDPKRGPRVASSRHAVLVMMLSGAPVTAGLIAGLPRLAIVIERRINSYLGVAGDDATAFSTNMVLGSTRGMLQSDTIVMRIDGPSPSYLRGAVYDRYHGRFWSTSVAGQRRVVAPLSEGRAPEEARLRITLTRNAPEGEDMRWFLPANVCDLSTTTPPIEMDAFGVARRAKTEGEARVVRATMYSDASRECDHAPPHVLDAKDDDLEVSTLLAPTLAALGDAWVVGAHTKREKLAAIKRELGRFEYSLAVTRDPHADPILDFLTVHKAGHCELFASAMVLLARKQGIAARLIGGYHVSEVNPWTKQTIVRERNAHAWVEAWIDDEGTGGSWHAWDPTPAGEGLARRSGFWDHLGDLASSLTDRVATVFARLGPLGSAAVLAALLIGYYASRWLWSVVRRVLPRLRSRRAAQRSGPMDEPLPCLSVLERTLELAGHPRDATEPLEVFARRIESVGAPWSTEVARALRRYAALRYGGVGDERRVIDAVTAASRAVTSPSP